MKTATTLKTRLLAGAILFAVVIRLVPYVLYRLGVQLDPDVTSYPWNFAPLSAVALFGAAHLGRARRSFLVPLAVLMTSDLLIGLLSGKLSYALYGAQPFVYAGHLLTVACGVWLVRGRASALRLAGTGLLAELVFFGVSNFGVWLTGTAYPHDPSGLLACYVAALPWLRNSLIGTAIYLPLLFGGYAWLSKRVGEPDRLAIGTGGTAP